MYKTRNAGMGIGIRGTWGLGGTLYYGECYQTFWGMLPNILGNVVKHSRECSQTIQRIFKNNPEHVAKHPVESMKVLRWMYIIVLDTGDHELYLFVAEPLLLNTRKRKRASLSFLTTKKETFKLFLIIVKIYFC